MNFPYLNKTVFDHTIPDPRANIPVKTPNFGFLNIQFLIDSGADVTILPLNPYAPLLRFKPDKDKPLQVQGLGRKVNAYPSQITIKVDKKEYPIHCYFVTSKTIPLLGRLDVWDIFSINFNNYHRRSEFTKL